LEDGTEIPATIIGQIRSQYHEDTMSQHLKQTNTDIFLIVLDTFMLHGHPENPLAGWFLKIDTSPAKTIFYYPSDGGQGMPVGCDLILRKCDLAVAYSKFAQKQVKDYYNLDTPQIPLGTETNRFYPFTEQQKNELKAKWGFQNKYIIGSVFRNQPRKFADRMLKTFALCKDKLPNAIMLLHCDPFDPAQSFNMFNMIKRYNLENRVFFTGMNAYNSFDWNKMNEVYNLFDCFFLTTSGEGWGIPFVEAMATECPVLATDYTTVQEIIKDNKAGLGINLSGVEENDLFWKNQKEYDIKTLDGTLTGSWEVDRGISSITDGAKKLVYLYENPEIRKEMGKNGRKAVLEQYDQKIVNKLWEDTFEKLLK